eukprot:6210449-Pleurochrysis_carterae.AAC.2
MAFAPALATSMRIIVSLQCSFVGKRIWLILELAMLVRAHPASCSRTRLHSRAVAYASAGASFGSASGCALQFASCPEALSTRLNLCADAQSLVF